MHGAYCADAAPVDRTAVLAALGILSHGPHWQLRCESRASWLAARPASIVARFVVRGIGAPRKVLLEAKRHDDIALVPAPYSLGRRIGPLVSLFLWWRCALTRWPRAMLIGKADDDVFVHLPGVAVHVRAAHVAVAQATGVEPRLLWGALESCHFDAEHHRPLSFVQDIPMRCREFPASQATRHHKADAHGSNATVHGPFPFAKGPLFFVSSSLVAELLDSEWLGGDVQATVEYAAEAPGRSSPKSTIPYEDIYVGMALARIPVGRGLALVESGLGHGRPSPTYSDGYGMQLSPSTLYWHMRTNVPYRLAFAHHWANVERHHCHLPPDGQWVKCRRRYRTVSCTGALWTRCNVAGIFAYRAANCSIELAELKHKAGAWHEARATTTKTGCFEESAMTS